MATPPDDVDALKGQIQDLEEQNEKFRYKWSRAEAWNMQQRAEQHKRLEELGQLPEQRWPSRFKRWSNEYLRLFGLQWL